MAREVHWPTSPPRLPALPCSAPPIVPGMPTSVSNPASPSRTTVETTCPSFAPPPTVTVRPCTLISENAGVDSRTTRPSTPSSRTSRFDPPPSKRICTPASWQRRTSAGQFLDRIRLGEKLGRPAELKPRVRRERLGFADDLFEAAEQRLHRFSQVSPASQPSRMHRECTATCRHCAVSRPIRPAGRAQRDFSRGNAEGRRRGENVGVQPNDPAGLGLARMWRRPAKGHRRPLAASPSAAPARPMPAHIARAVRSIAAGRRSDARKSSVLAV